jgi:hypothetical protein
MMDEISINGPESRTINCVYQEINELAEVLTWSREHFHSKSTLKSSQIILPATHVTSPFGFSSMVLTDNGGVDADDR